MYNRPFLNYDQQIERLTGKNVNIPDEDFAKKVLRNHSYYTLINGYKDLFPLVLDENGVEQFEEEVNFQTLYTLNVIDNNLNNILFKYILHVERSLKTKVAHLVAGEYGVHQDDYLNFRLYNSNGNLDRLTEIKNLKNQLNKTGKSASVDHYRKNHNHIPPWIAVNCFYFGSVINWYKILKSDLKKEIAGEFLDYFPQLDMDDKLTLLPDCLSLLQTYRNNMAHGNRTFETYIDSELPKVETLKILPKETLSENEFKDNIGRKDLYSVMLALSILIEDEYLLINFLVDLSNLFRNFTQDSEGNPSYIKLSPKGGIYETLDIPHNFKDRLEYFWSIKFNIPVG